MMPSANALRDSMPNTRIDVQRLVVPSIPHLIYLKLSAASCSAEHHTCSTAHHQQLPECDCECGLNIGLLEMALPLCPTYMGLLIAA